MSLRRSPTRTAAFLAANRSNARRSTGPRTVAGKARVALNSIRDGRRAFRLRANLELAGAREQAALYDWILHSICRCYEVPVRADGRLLCDPDYARQVEALAGCVFATYASAQAAWLQAKPESPFESRQFTNAQPLRIRIDNPRRTRRLAFWLQPGRGPNRFQRAGRQSIDRRGRAVDWRRGIRPRGGVPAGIRAPEVEIRDELGKRLVGEVQRPADELDLAAPPAAGGAAARARRWGRCRILPPTPRVMVYRRVEAAEGGLAPRFGARIAYYSGCFPGAGPRPPKPVSAARPAPESTRGWRLSPGGQLLAAGRRASRDRMPGLFRGFAEPLPHSNEGRAPQAGGAIAAMVRRGWRAGRRGFEAAGRFWNALYARMQAPP